MEFDVVPQIIIVFSMGIIILILGRNISKAKEAPDDFLFENRREKKEKENFLYLYKRLTRRINKEKYQEKVGLFWLWFEKVLRKLRINFLRLDNKIVSTLDKVKEKNVEAEDKNQQSEDNKAENICANDKNFDNSFSSKIENIDIEEKSVSKGDKNEIKVDELDIENRNKKGKQREYINLILKNPVDIKSYWKLGIVYSRRKNYKDAISCFRQITKIDPTYIKAKKKIIDLMGRMKKKKGNDGNDGNYN